MEDEILPSVVESGITDGSAGFPTNSTGWFEEISRDPQDGERRDFLAAMVWTRIAEGEDYAAVELVEEHGYAGALDVIFAETNGTTGTSPLNKNLARWTQRFDPQASRRDRERIEKLGGFLYPGDSRWPEGLNDLGLQRPLGLWFHGNADALKNAAFAIVGSRASSTYGNNIASDIAWGMAERGISIVSGGAFGIDAVAHEACVRAKGQTIVVFAGGVDRPYPRANTGLFGDILAGGGVFVSENPPGSAPLRHRFLGRNRIIAALADATLVAEAPYRSGALSTAHHALAIGREVGAVPGPVTAPGSAGCHRLLREGAQCITGFSDALQMLGIDPAIEEQLSIPTDSGDPMFGDPLTVRLRDALPVTRPVPAAKLAQRTGITVLEAMRCLGGLEMKGIAEQTSAGWRLRGR